VKSVFLDTLLQSIVTFLRLVGKGPFAELPNVTPPCCNLSPFPFILSTMEKNNSWTNPFA
jgi:hypothetical protein